MADRRRMIDALVDSRRSRSGASAQAGKVALGGLALILAVAYRAFAAHRGTPTPVLGAGPGQAGSASAAPSAAGLPASAAFDLAGASEDDATLYLKAMVAAAMADGQFAERERARITTALGAVRIADDEQRWLEEELASPATVDALAAPVDTPEQAAKVYAAARLAIEPDTLQEHDFLRRLAEALDVDPDLRGQIDAAASA